MTLGREVSRRTALKALGTGAGTIAFLPWLSDEGVAAFSNLAATQAKPALKVLTAAQYATTEAFAEAIIPADERSPGAKEARVADYIDLVLSESPAEPRKEWLEGLAAVDAEAMSRFKAPFVKLDAGQVEALLTDMSQFEAKPSTPNTAEPPLTRPVADIFGGVYRPGPDDPATVLERFFAVTKRATIAGYYTSEIGIHKELQYKGNQMLAEFTGCLIQDGKDCPHCGQKAEA
jgi:hypothetical protein